MCIAILKPKDKTLSEETLRTCAKANPDGMGFAYIDRKDNTLYIKKYMEFEDFLKDYKEVEHDSNMLIHFRIATHGAVEVNNCHPFRLNDRMALIHNGMITGYGDKATKSDTVDFIEKVIGNISWKMWKNPSFRKLVGSSIGYSKFAILDVTGDYFIINEEKGSWDDGVWYSNQSYKTKTTYTNTNTNTTNSGCNNKKNDVYSKYDEKFICYCRDCKKEFVVSYYDYWYTEICPSCGSHLVDEVGYIVNGQKFYYREYKKLEEKNKQLPISLVK